MLCIQGLVLPVVSGLYWGSSISSVAERGLQRTLSPGSSAWELSQTWSQLPKSNIPLYTMWSKQGPRFQNETALIIFPIYRKA